MNLKRIIGIFILCLFTIQINMTSCSTSDDNADNGNGRTAEVNEPTNDYQVVAQVISFGGLGGCTAVNVEQSVYNINDATVKINNIILPPDSSLDGLYQEESGVLSYLEGTNYTLDISHIGTQIATGTAVMPSVPVFKNLTGLSPHPLNQNMVVTWEAIENATSLELSLSGDVYDPDLQSEIERNFNSGLISASSNSFTIPDTFFTHAGEYTLGMTAYHGINPGSEAYNADDYLKSYNMKGAAGLFIVVNLSSEDGEAITVGNPGKIAAKSKDRPKYKDMVEKKLKRFFKKD
jgi:hypothetical protein